MKIENVCFYHLANDLCLAVSDEREKIKIMQEGSSVVLDPEQMQAIINVFKMFQLKKEATKTQPQKVLA